MATALDFHEDWLVCSCSLLGPVYNVSTKHRLLDIIIRQLHIAVGNLSVFYFTFLSALHKEVTWEYSMTSLSRHTTCSFLLSIRPSIRPVYGSVAPISFLTLSSVFSSSHTLPSISGFSVCVSHSVSLSVPPPLLLDTSQMPGWNRDFSFSATHTAKVNFWNDEKSLQTLGSSCWSPV